MDDDQRGKVIARLLPFAFVFFFPHYCLEGRDEFSLHGELLFPLLVSGKPQKSISHYLVIDDN